MVERVFLVQQPKRVMDMKSAKTFGEIVYLFEDAERRPSVFKSEEFIASIRHKLQILEFNHMKDFFCMAGGLIPVSIMLSVLTGEGRNVNVLMFNAAIDEYVVKSIAI